MVSRKWVGGYFLRSTRCFGCKSFYTEVRSNTLLCLRKSSISRSDSVLRCRNTDRFSRYFDFFSVSSFNRWYFYYSRAFFISATRPIDCCARSSICCTSRCFFSSRCLRSSFSFFTNSRAFFVCSAVSSGSNSLGFLLSLSFSLSSLRRWST